MNDIVSFAKRNCLAYFRDKASVLFSLLGVLIVILLYLIFLRNILIESVTGFIPAGFPVADGSISHMVDSWVLAGIMAIVSVTTSAGICNIMVNDKLDGKYNDCLMTALTPTKISAGYVLSTYLVGQIMSLITFVIVLICLVVTGSPMTFGGIALTLVLSVPASLSGAIIIYTCTCKMRSGGAFSGFFTVLSVLIGFLTGIYMPMGSMEGFMQTIGTLVPATHIASLMRQTLGLDSLNAMLNGAPAGVIDDLRLEMGYDLQLFGYQFTPLTSMIYVIVITVLFFGIAVLLNKRK